MRPGAARPRRRWSSSTGASKPSTEDLSWVDPSIADPAIDHAARFTYDHDYDGTGNWPFNTAYAASFGLSGHITRLSSLTDIEKFVKAGIPVITSQSFLASELDGAGYGTAGHIMVVVGFTENGDVIANDPASSSNDAVRNVYKRDQFANIWLRTKRVQRLRRHLRRPGWHRLHHRAAVEEAAATLTLSMACDFADEDYPAVPYPGRRPPGSFVHDDATGWALTPDPAALSGWRVDEHGPGRLARRA